MKVGWGTLGRGLAGGLRAVWHIAQVVVPAVMAVTVLERAGILHRLAAVFAPAMALFGLPGETALAFVVGNLVNFYGGVAILAGLGLTAKQATVAAAMLMLCHSSVQEIPFMLRAGARFWPVVGARLLAMGTGGYLLHRFLLGGTP